MISEGVIALALCAGAYFVLVDPVQSDLDALRAQQSVLPASPAPMLPAPEAAAQLARVSASLGAIEARSAAVRNEGALFASLSQSAQEAGLTVESVQPVPMAPRAAKPAAEGQPAPPMDQSRGFTMTVHGRYDALARFVRNLPRSAGYAAVRSVRLAPDFVPGSINVRASIQTEHIAMDLASARAALAGVGPQTASAPEASR